MEPINVSWQEPARLGEIFGRELVIDQGKKSITEENKQQRDIKPERNPNKPEKHSAPLRHKGQNGESDAIFPRQMGESTHIDRACLNQELEVKQSIFWNEYLKSLPSTSFLFPDTTQDPRFGTQTKKAGKHMHMLSRSTTKNR